MVTLKDSDSTQVSEPVNHSVCVFQVPYVQHAGCQLQLAALRQLHLLGVGARARPAGAYAPVPLLARLLGPSPSPVPLSQLLARVCFWRLERSACCVEQHARRASF